MQGLEEVRGLREGEITLRIGNEARVAAVTIGTYSLRLSLGVNLILKDCYYVLVVSRNLIFISVLARDIYNFHFNKDMCSIYFKNKVVARAFLNDGIYHLHIDASVNINEQIVNTIGSKRFRDRISQKYLWHLRLGHIGDDRLNKLKKDDLLGSLIFESYPVCESCLQEKMIKLSFVGQEKRTTEILALVHTDVCDPFDVQARSGYMSTS